MYRKVTFYKTLDGKCPVAEFIDSQPSKVAQKIAWVLKAVQELEKIPKTYFKKITDTDFYEVRIEVSGNIYRFLGFFHNGNIVILTNGFQKKTQKTPANEIERKEKDSEFAAGFDVGYEEFKIGMMIKEMRLENGMTQEQLAEKLDTKKSVISRMENHSEDIRLSTLQKVASVFGKQLKVAML